MDNHFNWVIVVFYERRLPFFMRQNKSNIGEEIH